MNDQVITDLARTYVDGSNQHNLDHVFPLFDAGATYRSSQFGAFEGIAAIREMMTGFFTKFPDVHWTVATYTPESEDTVVFDFVMRATDRESGNPVKRQGRERIRFSDTGLITHVEVEVTQT